MQLHELDKCEKRVAELRQAISGGGLSQRDYDSRCGELAGINWVIRELHLRPNANPLGLGQTGSVHGTNGTNKMGEYAA